MALEYIQPGKPTTFAYSDDVFCFGLPGNPVSTLVCALLFLRPALAVMLGADMQEADAEWHRDARLASPLPANDRRQDYLRARLGRDDQR